jgi:hypothetical protein
MQPVTVDLAEVTNIAVTLRWTALTGTDTGGLAVDVDGYELQWDQGSDTWDDLISLSAADLVYVHSPPLSAGQTYSYRIRAVNEYGSGDSWSTETQVFTAQPPETPSTPSVSITDLYVKIQWTEPFLNYLPLTHYSILLVDTDGLFSEVTSLCDGSAQTTITNRYCLIAMSSFWDEPLSLAQDDLIEAKVVAHNARGASDASPANTAGATVENKPEKMGALTQGSQTNHLQVHVTWAALEHPDNGSSAITSYNL